MFLPSNCMLLLQAKVPCFIASRKVSGQYKIRTCDLLDVNEMRYHCANCPSRELCIMLACLLPALKMIVRDAL